MSLNQRVSATLGEINSGVEKASAVMTQIADSARVEQEELAHITEAVSHIGALTQNTAANAEESASAASELGRQAREMSELAARFTLESGDARPGTWSDEALPLDDDHDSFDVAPAAWRNGSSRAFAR